MARALLHIPVSLNTLDKQSGNLEKQEGDF
jgi:hypothetical protein